jgi:hypothetical protein
VTCQRALRSFVELPGRVYDQRLRPLTPEPPDLLAGSASRGGTSPLRIRVSQSSRDNAITVIVDLDSRVLDLSPSR